MQTLTVRNINNKRMARLLETAKYMYKSGYVPEGKEKKLLDVIARLEDLVTYEF